MRPVSQKQYRYLKAIMSGKPGHSSRGDRIPKSVASKYDLDGDADKLPKTKNKEHGGGSWEHDKHHSKKHKDVKKSFEEFYKGQAVGAVIINKQGHILIGQDHEGRWQTSGGHIENGEDAIQALLREVQEETGLTPTIHSHIGDIKSEGNHAKVFAITNFSGKLGSKTDGELKNLKFVAPADLPKENMRHCAVESLKLYFNGKLSKNLSDMVALEILEKNIIRSQVGTDVVYEMKHSDALQLVGTSTFRWLRSITAGMKDEDFKEVEFDTYKIHLRRHASDVYSGRIVDGHKLVHQWTNRSLPSMAAEIMSVFEWYQPEDEKELHEIKDSDLEDGALEGGLSSLMDNFKRHNIGNIYNEMSTIRNEIRQGVAVDLQQVEQRIMKLFDRLDETIATISGQHNKLCSSAGEELDVVHQKLAALQSQLDSIGLKPTKVEAYSAAPSNPNEVYSDNYMYLSKPKVVITPDGKITIEFGPNWTPMERDNFLTDLKAKAIKKGQK